MSAESSPLSYVLKLLIAYGSRASEVYTELMVIVEAVKKILAIGGVTLPEDGTLSLVSPTDEEAELERHLAILMTPEGTEAAFDGSRLRAAVKFLKDTGLLDVVVSVLLKKAAGV